jgi:hypothetical protein
MGITMKYSFCALIFPYCLEQLSDGKYIVLNRKYKPIGSFTTVNLDYEKECPMSHLKINGLKKEEAKLLSWNGSDNVEKIYLYKDGCAPTNSQKDMEEYFERLARLANYKCHCS